MASWANHLKIVVILSRWDSNLDTCLTFLDHPLPSWASAADSAEPCWQAQKPPIRGRAKTSVCISSWICQDVDNHIALPTSGRVSESMQQKYGDSKLPQWLGQQMPLQAAPSPLHTVFATVDIPSKHW